MSRTDPSEKGVSRTHPSEKGLSGTHPSEMGLSGTDPCQMGPSVTHASDKGSAGVLSMPGECSPWQLQPLQIWICLLLCFFILYQKCVCVLLGVFGTMMHCLVLDMCAR